MTTIEMKYGVTEYKKRELDSITRKVLNAENKVTQLEAIVTALTQKSNMFQGFLDSADANRAQALSNMNLVDAVVKNAQDLKDNSSIALDEMTAAIGKTGDVAQNAKAVIGKLIYTADSINKLAGLIVRKKAQNYLISDELVSMITTAGADANNAVALQLTALKAAFAAQSSNQDAEAACALEYSQAIRLYDVLTTNAGTDVPGSSLQQLLHQANDQAQKDYAQALSAFTETLNQLEFKTTELNKAQTNLKSLQLGLAAANAAALAS
ncbi:hypothetical protein [Flavobacterium sp.]|uniref:hypothetical protein n=1 Tax=Flavobacterium sp. TaxID=239 RepID=UPI0039E639B8